MAGLNTNTILRVVSNDELRKEEEQAARNEMEQRQQAPLLTGLLGHMKTCFDAAKDARTRIDTIMLKAKRQRNGEYESDKLAAIRKHGGSEVFVRLTEVKCRAAESWVRDILLDGGAPPWDLQPTPIPDLDDAQEAELKDSVIRNLLGVVQSTGMPPNPDQMQEIEELALQEYRFRLHQKAQNKADRMAQKIKDQFAEGGWYEGFNAFVTDLTTYPCAFMKGPVIRKAPVMSWGQGQTGKTEVAVEQKLIPQFERVDPFRIYPEPGISDINDGYIFEHHPMSRSDLAALIGVPGYDEEAVRAILDQDSRQSWFFNDVELTKNEEERKFSSWRTPTSMYDALEFWGKVSGKMLREWGMTAEEIPDEAQEYDACVWSIGNYIIKATLNYDPLGEKPYAKCSFFKVPGAFWGIGIPEMIEDIQNVCNASVRALVNNMGIASGPQVEVNVDRIPTNEDVTQVYPWKVWQVLNDPLGSTAPAIRFEQPDDRSANLMGVYEKWSQLADEHSGIPSYVSGDISVTGAGRTSSGLSMLMGAAGKGIRQVVSHIDNDVIKVIVERQFVYNMRYDEDESIKGDVVVVPRGAVNLAVKETVNARRIEFLQATANPIDAEIVGREGRAVILREVAKSLQMPDEEIVPSRERASYNARMDAMAGLGVPGQASPVAGLSPPGSPTPQHPGGQPKGGQDGNTVTNRQTGQA